MDIDVAKNGHGYSKSIVATKLLSSKKASKKPKVVANRADSWETGSLALIIQRKVV